MSKHTPGPWKMKRTDDDMEATGLIMGAEPETSMQYRRSLLV